MPRILKTGTFFITLTMQMREYLTMLYCKAELYIYIMQLIRHFLWMRIWLMGIGKYNNSRADIRSHGHRYTVTRSQIYGHMVTDIRSHGHRYTVTWSQIYGHTVTDIRSHGHRYTVTRSQIYGHMVTDIRSHGHRYTVTCGTKLHVY